jgi:hypothetical protein
MNEVTETMAEYVMRKLKEPHTNIAALCEKINANRSRVYRFMNSPESANISFVQKLNDYFKALGN